jgi:hypothetical protein
MNGWFSSKPPDAMPGSDICPEEEQVADAVCNHQRRLSSGSKVNLNDRKQRFAVR